MGALHRQGGEGHFVTGPISPCRVGLQLRVSQLSLTDRALAAGGNPGWPVDAVGGAELAHRSEPSSSDGHTDHAQGVPVTTTNPLPHLLTIEELADHLGVTVRHIRR